MIKYIIIGVVLTIALMDILLILGAGKLKKERGEDDLDFM